MTEVGYLGLFVASFLAATILPFSSEALLVAMIAGGFDTMATVVVASLGNWLGSMSTYALGYIGDWKRIERWLKIDPSKTEKYLNVTHKYGSWLGLVVWVPGVGDVIAICMGLLRTPVLWSTILILIGKFARYAVLAYLTLKGTDIIV